MDGKRKLAFAFLLPDPSGASAAGEWHDSRGQQLSIPTSLSFPPPLPSFILPSYDMQHLLSTRPSQPPAAAPSSWLGAATACRPAPLKFL